MKKHTSLLLVCLFVSLGLAPSTLSAFTPSVSLSYGTGKPDGLKGRRVALRAFWPWTPELAFLPVVLRGCWDFSVADWQVSPPEREQPRSILIFAASPVLRLQARNALIFTSQPLLEAGIGLSTLSRDHLGHRDLGARFAFQDMLGFGLHWDMGLSLSYHYLHYSNAGLFPPNRGIDVKHLVTLAYEFS